MTGKTKKILEEIHPLLIIREVQKWPALYVKDNTERSNAHFKFKIWGEIAKALFPEWDSYSKLEKSRRITDLNKKWRNLRDTFKRQVGVERKIREGQDIKKKTYVYYKHMSFLLPHFHAGDSEDEPAPAPAPAPLAAKRPRDTAAPRAAALLDDIDEDKHFVMSLIPSLKKMTEEEKLTAKVEILKVIKGVRTSTSTSSFNYQVVDTLAYNTEMEVIKDNGEIKKEMLNEEPVKIDYEEQVSEDEDSE